MPRGFVHVVVRVYPHPVWNAAEALETSAEKKEKNYKLVNIKASVYGRYRAQDGSKRVK